MGRIDVLINNAGALVKRAPLETVTDELFDEIININARSVVAFTRAVIPVMRGQGGGNIINVTSVAARHGGGPGALIYAASKGFVSTITRGMAKELLADKIRVNAVAPGVIMTPFRNASPPRNNWRASARPSPWAASASRTNAAVPSSTASGPDVGLRDRTDHRRQRRPVHAVTCEAAPCRFWHGSCGQEGIMRHDPFLPVFLPALAPPGGLLRDKLALLLDSTGEGIYGIDLEGRCTFINRAGAYAGLCAGRGAGSQHARAGASQP
jgi:PAS domain-containing protein